MNATANHYSNRWFVFQIRDEAVGGQAHWLWKRN